MKYTLLTSSNSRLSGGVFEVIRQLGIAISSSKSNEFSILSYNDKYSNEDLLLYGKTPMFFYTRCKFPILKTIGYSRDIYKILETNQPKLIDTQGLWMYFSAVALKYKKSHGTKIVITPHGMLDPWAVKNSVWKKRIVGHLFEYENLNKADCIKALCKSEYESIRAFGLKNPVAIIPNGISVPQNVVFDRGHIEKTLLFIGRIHPKKGIKELIEAFANVRNIQPEIAMNWQLKLQGGIN